MHEIYEKYSKLVYNYLFSLTKNVEISQELMQETFYCAVKNIKKFKGECSVKTWLLKIAQNKWKDYLKSTKNKHFLSYDENSLKEEELLQQPSLELETFEKERLFLLYQLIHRPFKVDFTGNCRMTKIISKVHKIRYFKRLE